jgi:WD40 repeat protein
VGNFVCSLHSALIQKKGTDHSEKNPQSHSVLHHVEPRNASADNASTQINRDDVESMVAMNSPPPQEPEKMEDEQVDQDQSDYELQRLKNIERNNAMLAELGLGVGSASHTPMTDPPVKSKSRKKSWPKMKATMQDVNCDRGIRRSTRNTTKPPVNYEDDVNMKATSGAVEVQERVGDVQHLPEDFDDSTVFKYSCASTLPEVDSNGSTSPLDTEGTTNGDHAVLKGFSLLSSQTKHVDDAETTRRYRGVKYFHKLSVPVSDLKRLYSMHFDSSSRLLGAAGMSGWSVVFGVNPLDGYSHGSPEDKDGDNDDSTESLLCWKAHKSWIAEIQFVDEIGTKKSKMVLTASNDGTVAGWDLNKTLKGFGDYASPQRIFSVGKGELHDNGLWGMHCVGSAVATCSKDGTLCYSRLAESGLARITSYKLGKVVKTVSIRTSGATDMQDWNVIASGGNDCCLRVYDVRAPKPLVAEAPGAHTSAINCVKWHPTNPHWLVSSSFDAEIPVHDLRKFGEPLYHFSGHHATTGKIKMISRPVFWGGGSLITNGQSSDRLSIYDVSNGKVMSRGSLGFVPVSLCPSERILAVSNSSGETFLCPPVFN